MPLSTEAMTSDRLACLARAALECRRCAAPPRAGLAEAWREELDRLDRAQRQATQRELEGLLGHAPGAPAVGVPPAGATAGDAQELLRQRARLELELQSAAQRYEDLEAALRRERDEHRQAVESLALQQRKLKELRAERSKLLTEVGQIESRLRLQTNETEQVRLKYDKLKSARKSLGDQATEQTEQITALKAERERLRAELEAARRQRDTQVADAQAKAACAEGQTADAAYRRLWARLHAEIPEVFVETHAPTQRTFESACDALAELVRVFATLELHVHHMLRDLRQVSAQADKLNHFYIILTKNPGVIDTLRDYLTTGKRKRYFCDLLRAHQAWTRAFGSGTYKAIVRSPVLISEELNYRSWPIKTGFTVSAEAAIGKHFKEVIYKAAPERAGTRLRKQAADMAYDDYNTLMKRQR